MKYALVALTALSSTACASAQALPAAAAAAPPIGAAPAIPAQGPPLPPVAAPLPPLPMAGIGDHHLQVRPTLAELRVRSANRSATREPQAQGFVNALQIYPFNEGVLYRLLAAPERVTDIALQPGEAIVSVAAGDTVRWTVGDTTSGSGEGKRVHILVKPFAAGLFTNLIITTDRRAYHLQLSSTSSTAMAGLSWTYPADELIAIKRQATEARAAQSVASGLPIENLNFAYRITGDNPAWRPLRAFDDGRQTFIEFSPSIAVGEAPPLFVIGEQGEASLVNYRMSGRFYVVDRLFAAAELRLGAKKQAIVRITRTADQARHGARRPS